MGYVGWALLGMVGYSLVTLLVKLATRSGEVSSFYVLALAVLIVGSVTWAIAILRGDFSDFTVDDLARPSTMWSFATGIALVVAVASLFKALSLGPATEVVPIYGMFVVGGAILGIIFLNEPVTHRKLLGIAFAALSIYLIAK
jgi:bacterial/archaeal transporter family protein